MVQGAVGLAKLRMAFGRNTAQGMVVHGGFIWLVVACLTAVRVVDG